MHISDFKQLPLMGILRGIEEKQVAPLCETVISAGLQTIEITMNTQKAPFLIRKLLEEAQGKLTVGAGTVLTMEDLQLALDAGASFIVSPVRPQDVVTYCVHHGIPVFPGALTPQEIEAAWRAGATMVKVFPSKFFGPSYFKEIKGPLSDIELMACGGVNPQTIGDFFHAGASAAAFGASVFKKEWLASGQFDSIGQSVKALVQHFLS